MSEDCKHEWHDDYYNGIECDYCYDAVTLEYLEAQEAKIEKLKSLLKKAEWGERSLCLFCCNNAHSGHEDDCELAEALK